jgi:hypothetical protein
MSKVPKCQKCKAKNRIEKVLAPTSDVQDGREMVAGMTGGDEEKGSSEARK